MKHFILLFVLIAFALPVVNAVPDSVVTGPYKVSFDLGLPQGAYSVTENAPVMDETMGGDERAEYSVTISNKSTSNKFITISLISVKNLDLSLATSSIMEDVLRGNSADDPRISGFKSDSRIIDGMNGAIASMNMELDSGRVLSVYNAIYQAPFDPKATMVNILSSYPWNEGTLQLLKTLHVEKI